MMRQSFYRLLISIFAIWAALSIPTLLAPTLFALHSNEPLHNPGILLLIGFALLPVSVVGLWNLQLWGFISLMLASILVIATYPEQVTLHAFCIGLTIFRYCLAHRDDDAEHPIA